jgi:hypothetical protein
MNMKRKSVLLAFAIAVVAAVSVLQAMYFMGADVTQAQDEILDTISYIFPFQPVVVFYAFDKSPLMGIPCNVILLLLLLIFSGFFSSRPTWMKIALFLTEWLVLSIVGSVVVLRAVWHV